MLDIVYYGEIEAMIAEVAAFDPRSIVNKKECRYLVMPMGDVQYDTEWFSTKKLAYEYARYVSSQYAGSKVVAV